MSDGNTDGYRMSKGTTKSVRSYPYVTRKKSDHLLTTKATLMKAESDAKQLSNIKDAFKKYWDGSLNEMQLIEEFRHIIYQ